MRASRIILAFTLTFLSAGAIGSSDSEMAQAVRRVIDKTRTSDSAVQCNGRLTLSSGIAVPTSDVVAATSVYFTPYNGAKISLYTSSAWRLMNFAETSVSVPATTVLPFDIFAYNNSGTLALETLSWTDDNNRSQPLDLQNGVLVQGGLPSRRYLGTARTTSVSGQTEDSAAKRYLWNMCNRVRRKLLALSTTDNWTYTTATWRAANNVTTTGVTRVEFVLGQQIDLLKLKLFIPKALNSTNDGVFLAGGIGINSTTVNSADVYGSLGGTESIPLLARYNGNPPEGFNYAQWLEISVASGTFTWASDFQFGGWQRQGGLMGEISN